MNRATAVACRRGHPRATAVSAVLFLVLAVVADPLLAQQDYNHQKGPARRWGAAMSVTPYSAVNMETGRVTTTLDVVGWSGRGPAIGFSLYHNQPEYVGALNNEQMLSAMPTATA